MAQAPAPKPKIALLLGDPCGIGPELVVKVLAEGAFESTADLVVMGDKRVLDHEMQRIGADLEFQVCDNLEGFDPENSATRFLQVPVTPVDLEALPVGTANEIGGRYTMEVLSTALDLAAARKIDAVTYAPMNKKAMNLAGWHYRDGIDFCTSHLKWDGTVSEFNVLDHLWVARVTSHVPMRNVWEYLTADRVYSIIALLNRSLVASGVESPRIAVAGYNPHCGEGGLCGTEEIDGIIPAIDRAKAEGMDVYGPVSADVVYIEAREKELNGIIAMYHDQCQIANKLLEFDRGFVIHGGSPVPTLTTAHGTAFDIVGAGKANPVPLSRCVSTASMIARNRALFEGVSS